jgi:hypothetical protein
MVGFNVWTHDSNQMYILKHCVGLRIDVIFKLVFYECIITTGTRQTIGHMVEHAVMIRTSQLNQLVHER